LLPVAYLANQFPSSVEPYVMEEIDQLRRRGVRVVAGSACRPDPREEKRTASENELGMIVLQPLRLLRLLQAGWLLVKRWPRVAGLVKRVVFQGSESPVQRLKTLLHTWMGAYYALLLEGSGVEHIHVHHGYFGSWIAMTAARLLGVNFSMTLHGSDLLLHGAYLDAKLKSCAFCLTVSEYNRRYILERYPGVDAGKLAVTRLGVGVPEFSVGEPVVPQDPPLRTSSQFTLLAVGRLHAVKDHAFLVRACAQLHARGLGFECVIAGEGPERKKLEALIRKYGLEDSVTLLGHVPREQMDSLYRRADAVVLTSRSEGIPLVLMEAMAKGKIVLAPAITGIPELVVPGKTGFLYEPGALGDFIARILFIHSLVRSDQRSENHSLFLSAANPLDWVKHGAQSLVRHNFNRKKNLELFADYFVQQISNHSGSLHEDLVLQQI
jgi:colanic acid/amylovoran biosynthesis glycosyltransferase